MMRDVFLFQKGSEFQKADRQGPVPEDEFAEDPKRFYLRQEVEGANSHRAIR
jgi:hypothetical protein